MGRIFVGWAGMCVAASFALQPARADDRKPASVRPGGTSIRGFVFAAQARSAGDDRGGRSIKAQGRGEFSFFPVYPLKSEVRGLKSEVEDARRAPTPPRERKPVTFFRLGPKLGDISVQPVVGGVNGAQFSLGF